MADNPLKAFAALALVGSTSVLSLAAAPAKAQDYYDFLLQQQRLIHEQQMQRQAFDAEQAALQRRYNERQYHQDRNHQLTNNFIQSFWGNSSWGSSF